MSRNLIKAGHDLVVYNRTRSLAQEMRSSERKSPIPPRKRGPEWKCSSRCWLTDRAVQDVIFEPGLRSNRYQKERSHISMSTISVDLSRGLAKSPRINIRTTLQLLSLAGRMLRLRQAVHPVSAGPSESIEKCRSLFARLGQEEFHDQ